MTLIWLAVGVGCLWHGAQIIWVAPTPTQLRRDKPSKTGLSKAQAFQMFWLDQYGWMGISLVGIGLLSLLAGLLR